MRLQLALQLADYFRNSASYLLLINNIVRHFGSDDAEELHICTRQGFAWIVAEYEHAKHRGFRNVRGQDHFGTGKLLSQFTIIRFQNLRCDGPWQVVGLESVQVQIRQRSAMDGLKVERTVAVPSFLYENSLVLRCGDAAPWSDSNKCLAPVLDRR